MSADGQMAAEQAGQYGTHKFWASAPLIAAANAALAGAQSVIRLKQGAGTLDGKTSSGEARILMEVEPENTATHTSAGAMEIWADCGRSARDVIGVGGGTGGHNLGVITGKYNGTGQAFSTSASDPKEMADEIMAQTLGGGDPKAGWAKYRALTPKARAAFDKKTGINRYATPDVGEGYTMASGSANYPNVSTWNFHWAGVVMRSGGDTVTLENYATGQADEKNTDWNFQMYGPSSNAGQTFHDQHQASHQHGKTPTTIEVAKQ